ncbi:MAG TPA: SRPBCC domain-containing protein, partial [Polyangiaceae bacterium]
MTIKHDTFTIERTLDASPERVFEALSKPEVKARWFVGPAEWKQNGERRMDFRVGGTEHLSGTHAGGIT